MPVSGSTLVAAQRTIRLVTFSRARADGEFGADQAELVPGRPALDVEVAAEAQRVNRRADHGLDRRHRGEIDDRDDLGGDIREAVVLGLQHFRRPAQLRRHGAAEKRLDREPSLLGGEVAARQLAALAADDQRVRRIVVARVERRQPLVFHQHQEVALE